MAKVIKTKNGKKYILLNPNQKARQYALSIKMKRIFYPDGNSKPASKENIAYMQGFLDCRKEQSRIWCKQNGIISYNRSFKEK